MSGLDEAQRARLTDYLDGTLPEDEAARLEASLADDSRLAQELDDARAGLALLASLSAKPAPQHFVRKVQRRIRRRTGGRFFSPVRGATGLRISIETFAVIAVVVMAACYFFLEVTRAPTLGPLHDITPPDAQRPSP